MTLSKGRSETPVTIHPADAIYDGTQTVTTAGTRVQLIATTTGCRLVNIYALSTNTGNVYVGGATIASGRGMILEQARSTDWFPIDDLSKVYIDADNNGDGVAYAYVV